MAEQLKNTLSFNLAPGATAVLPHGLETSLGTPLAPDIIFVPSAELEVSSDTINVTLTNRGGFPLTGAALVESWHTIERAFGGAQFTDLPVKPYIVFGESEPIEPPFTPSFTTIYARTTGNDTTGDGTLAKPYRTLQRAVRDVPVIISASAIYRVDITGITELLPPDYTLPAWKAPNTSLVPAPNPLTIFQSPVEIFATPQPVAAIPLADCTINVGDVASVTIDALTKLRTINLVTPRASWTTANIGGKQVIDGAVSGNNTVVAKVLSTSSIVIANAASPTFPLQLVEPSAFLHGSGAFSGTIRAINVDSIGFTGIKITSDNGMPGLVADGSGECICQLCELQSPWLTQQTGAVFFTTANRAVRCWIYGSPTFGGTIGIVQTLVKNARPSIIPLGPLPFFGVPTVPTIRRAVFTACDPLEVNGYEPGGTIDGGTAPHITMQNVLVELGVGAGMLFHGNKCHMSNCDFAGNTGDGITVSGGAGLLAMINVGSSVQNGSSGISITNGMQVAADVLTTGNATPLSGAGAQITLGSVGSVTWATVAGAPNNVADYAGASATGARIYQG